MDHFITWGFGIFSVPEDTSVSHYCGWMPLECHKLSGCTQGAFGVLMWSHRQGERKSGRPLQGHASITHPAVVKPLTSFTSDVYPELQVTYI